MASVTGQRRVTEQSEPNLAEVKVLIAVAREAGLGGRVPARDVIRTQVRELSGYLNALRTTIETRDRVPADRQLRRDALTLLVRTPESGEPTLRQAEHLRQLARVTGRFLDIAQRRQETVS